MISKINITIGFNLWFILSFMLYFVETGLTNYIRSKTTASDRPCRTDVKPNGKISAFKLVDFTSTFFLFGCGVALSLLALLLELFVGRVLSSKEFAAAKKKNDQRPNIVIVKPAIDSFK